MSGMCAENLSIVAEEEIVQLLLRLSHDGEALGSFFSRVFSSVVKLKERIE